MFAALYLSVGGILLFLPFPWSATLAIIGVLVLVAAPHAYLGLYVEKGRGRILQTVLAALSLFNFPLGTAFGVFALWVVWGGEHAPIFDDPSLAEAPPDPEEEEGAVDRESSGGEPTNEDDGGESPYSLARRLHKSGSNAREIREHLAGRSLGDDEIKTVLGALGLKMPARSAAAPKRPSRPASPRAEGKRAPPATRRRPPDDE